MYLKPEELESLQHSLENCKKSYKEGVKFSETILKSMSTIPSQLKSLEQEVNTYKNKSDNITVPSECEQYHIEIQCLIKNLDCLLQDMKINTEKYKKNGRNQYFESVEEKPSWGEIYDEAGAVIREGVQQATEGVKSYLESKKNEITVDGVQKAAGSILGFFKKKRAEYSTGGIQRATADIYSYLQQKGAEYSAGIKEQATEIKGQVVEAASQYQKKSGDFYFTVFGRTNAGKSTLMSILTNGNNESIGEETRKTTDVRRYAWNNSNLYIVDVPGICASKDGGEEDKKLAFDAIKHTDVVLFLMTDDAVQIEEAEALARIKAMGKPVICILNVKTCGPNMDSRPIDFRLRRIQRNLGDTERLDKIKAQFLQFSKEFKQNWNDIPFIYTDLRTAWLAQQPGYEEKSEELYHLSNFSNVTTFVLQQIQMNGGFYSFKGLVDTLYPGAEQTHQQLMGRYASNLALIYSMRQKQEELRSERRRLRKVAEEQVKKCIDRIHRHLKDEISVFADSNYENEQAGNDWEKVVTKENIPDQFNKLGATLSQQYEKSLINFVKTIPKANKGQSKVNTNGIAGESIIDVQFGLNLLAAPLVMINPLVALVAGLLIWGIFDSKDKKIKKRKNALKQALLYWLDGSGEVDEKTKNKMKTNMPQPFMTTLYKEGTTICTVLDDVVSKVDAYYAEMIHQFIDINRKQLQLTKDFQDMLCNMNLKLLQKILPIEAFNNKMVLDTARITGEGMLIVTQQSSAFPKKQVEGRLQEPVYIFPTEDSTFSQLPTNAEFQAEYIKQILMYLLETNQCFNVGFTKAKDSTLRINNRAREIEKEIEEDMKGAGSKGPLSATQVSRRDTAKEEAHKISLFKLLVEQLFSYPIQEYPIRKEEA